jgi:hypothetical protein
MTKQCTYCGTTKALTKHSLSGNHKAPFVPACEFCHGVINGANQKSLEKLFKRTERRARKQVELLELFLEKRQPDGTFLIPDVLKFKNTEG